MYYIDTKLYNTLYEVNERTLTTYIVLIIIANSIDNI